MLELLYLTLRVHNKSFNLGTLNGQGGKKSWFNCKKALHCLSYWSVSIIAEIISLIQSKNLKKTFCNLKKKFSELEKAKKLAVQSKKLADIKAKKAAGFVISRNPEKEATNEPIIQKISRKSKFALLFVEVYSRQTYSY